MLSFISSICNWISFIASLFTIITAGFSVYAYHTISYYKKGLLDIKVLNLKDPISERYDKLLDNEIDAGVFKEKAKTSNRLFGNVLFEVYVATFVIFGVLMMTNGWMKMDVFITIFMYKFKLFTLLFDLMDVRSYLKEMSVLAKRMNKLLLIDDYKLEKFGEVNGINSSVHSIKFKESSSSIIFSLGKKKPLFTSAERIRSRLSKTVLPAMPTMLKQGRPWLESLSMVIILCSKP